MRSRAANRRMVAPSSGLLALEGGFDGLGGPIDDLRHQVDGFGIPVDAGLEGDQRLGGHARTRGTAANGLVGDRLAPIELVAETAKEAPERGGAVGPRGIGRSGRYGAPLWLGHRGQNGFGRRGNAHDAPSTAD